MARILIGNIKGPKGDTGPRGATGPTGPAGPQGPLPPLTNNFLATVAGKSALDAAAGKVLKDQLDQQNSDLASVKKDITNVETSITDFQGSFAHNTIYLSTDAAVAANAWGLLNGALNIPPGYTLTGVWAKSTAVSVVIVPYIVGTAAYIRYMPLTTMSAIGVTLECEYRKIKMII